MEQNETKRLSKTAIAEYKARLDDLKNVKRLEVAEQIKEARAFGDISENAEYDAAMDNQARIEYEIVQLEELLANVEEIDEQNIDLSVVSVGGRVKLQYGTDNKIEEFDIVSTSEAEPFARTAVIECNDSSTNKELGYKKGEQVKVLVPAKLSNESPVGRAILGHKTGDSIDVVAPIGVISYEILSIERVTELPQGKVISEQVVSVN